MALLNTFRCLKWCLLSDMRFSSVLQKQLFACSAGSKSDQVTRQLSTAQEDNSDPGKSNIQPEPDYGCVHFSGDWSEESKTGVLQNMLVFPDFISESEEDNIMAEIGPYLKRMRYEFDHWDDAIHGFRETERLKWRPENDAVLERVRRLAIPPGTPPLHHVHVLDLAADGVIKPHVDSVRFCGSVITGISLLSEAVMRLVACSGPPRQLDALLPRRSLYIMRHTARYDYTHQVLADSESQFGGRPVPRARRISIICRNEPPPPPPPEEGQGSDSGQAH